MNIERTEWAAPASRERINKLHYVPVLLLALLLRAFAAVFMFRNDPQIWFYNQASELSCLARSVLAGQGLSSPFGGSTGPSAFLAPGYPLLVAFIYRLFGIQSLTAAVALTSLQVIFGVLTVAIAMSVAKHLFGNRTAYIAGALCAISPTMVWLPTLFWETSLSTLFLLSSLALVLRCVDRPLPSTWICFGLFCAFALLVNPALMVTLAAEGLWSAYKTRATSLRAPLLAVTTCGLLFAIWPIRNAISLHAFIPLRSNLGYELWQGNRPGSEGFFSPTIYLNADREEFQHYAAVGELTYMHEKSTRARATIKADPWRFTKLSFKRVEIFWTALGGHNISWLVITEIMLSSMTGITGLIFLLRRGFPGSTLLLIPFLLFPAPYYITHPDFRFRLLLQPIAMLLTAWLIQEAIDRANAVRQ